MSGIRIPGSFISLLLRTFTYRHGCFQCKMLNTWTTLMNEFSLTHMKRKTPTREENQGVF